MDNMNYVEAAAEALEMAETVVASEVATEIVEVVVVALEVDMVEVVVVTTIFTLGKFIFIMIFFFIIIEFIFIFQADSNGIANEKTNFSIFSSSY